MNALVRPFTVERRGLQPRQRIRPTPDSVAALKAIAGSMRNMPRECALDRAELLLWLSRMARQLEAVALDGVVLTTCAPASRVARQRLLPRSPADPRAIAEALFGKSGGAVPHRAKHSATIHSRKGRPVRAEVRRRALVAAGQTELAL